MKFMTITRVRMIITIAAYDFSTHFIIDNCFCCLIWWYKLIKDEFYLLVGLLEFIALLAEFYPNMLDG